MSQNVPLPDPAQEIIINVLSRLLIKSLLKFKCVLKPWISLISCLQFAKVHLHQLNQNNTTRSRVFMDTFQSFDLQTYFDDNGDYETAILMEYDALKNAGYLGLVDSYDGLVCGSGRIGIEDLFVFNPTTQRMREIPTPEFYEKGILYSCGFGYVSKIDHYKIVRGFIFSLHDVNFRIEVFKLKENFQTKGVLLNDLIFGEGVFLNWVFALAKWKGYWNN